MRRLLPGVLLLAACDAGLGQSQGALADDLGIAAADYLVVDLEDGGVEPRTAIPDLEAGAAYRDRLLVFRRLPPGTAAMGIAGSGIGESDELNLPSRPVGRTWMAVFELTRGQWRRLGGDDQGGDPGLPASVRPSALLRVLAARRSRGLELDLPTDAEWTWAATAGADTAFAWGESMLDSDSSPRAVVNPLPGSALAAPGGPARVGSRQANAWGLHDLHGNLWELVAEEAGASWSARGGCWCQGVAQARRSNRLELTEDAPHPLVGARLVWR